MSKPTKKEILSYARKCRQQRPEITEKELKAILQARFIDGRDPLADAVPFGGLGAISNPFDWLVGLSKIFNGLRKFFNDDLSGIEEIIDGVVIIVIEEE